MKKLRTTSFLLALLISASSCSCGGSVDDDPKVTGSETQTSETTADALSDGLDGLNFGGKQTDKHFLHELRRQQRIPVLLR